MRRFSPPPHSGKIIGVRSAIPGCRISPSSVTTTSVCLNMSLQPSCTLVNEAERGFS
ncbi:hypothetical protein ABLN85_17070 [Mycobacterium tuberculosis]